MKKILIIFGIVDGLLTLVAIAAGIGYVVGRNAGLLDAELIHRAEVIEVREDAWQRGYNAAEVDRSVLRNQEPEVREPGDF